MFIMEPIKLIASMFFIYNMQAFQIKMLEYFTILKTFYFFPPALHIISNEYFNKI